MTLELYPGYLNLGGNEIVNNERTRGILEGLDCPVDWFKDKDDRCLTIQNAIDPPILGPWIEAGRNLATNPSMETAGAGSTEVRRNYIKDPRGMTSATEWGAFSATMVGVADGVTATITGSPWRFGPEAQMPVSTLCRVRMEILVSTGATFDVYYRPSGHSSTSAQVAIATAVTVQAGVTFVLDVPFTTLAQSPTSAAGIFLTGTGLIGATIKITKAIAEAAPVVGPYFDGTTASPSPDLTRAWSGTADASPSTLSGVPVASMTGGVGSTAWAANRTKSLFVPGGVGAANDSYSVLAPPAGGWVPGESYTILATMRLAAAQTGALNARARRIAVVFSDATEVLSDAAPNEAGTFECRVSFTAPAGPTTTEVRLYNGAGRNAGDTWWDAVLITEIDSPAAPYVGGYFDGAISDEPLTQYSWLGAADGSASQMETRQLFTPPPYTELSVADAPWYDLDLPTASGDFFGAYALRVQSTTDSTRQTPVAESILNGGTIGRTRLATRSVRVEVMLFARNSAGLEYGRSWLDSVTQPGACGQHGDRCGVTDLQFLAACPPSLADYPADGEGYNEDVEALVRFMHAVSVTSGPFTVGEYRFASNGFVSQIVEFTITSERAYIYGRTRDVDLPTSDSSVVQDIPYNLVPYPSAEIADADVTIATNLSTNPSVETNSTDWVSGYSLISGSSPSSYITETRSTDIASVGLASFRVRLLGNSVTEVASSRSMIIGMQDVVIPAGTGRRVSLNMWAGAIIAAGGAVSVLNGVQVEAIFYTAGGSVIGSTITVGEAGPTEMNGRPYSLKSVAVPDTAAKVRVRARFDVTWQSSATAANNSDIRAYVDALAVSIP